MKNIDTEESQVIDRIYLTIVYKVIAVLEERASSLAVRSTPGGI